jgi:DNA-directed RNA polymerase subunit RPC12/RpoP
MSSIYCTECGTKIEFTGSNKPKFCSNCGTPIPGGSIEKNKGPGLGLRRQTQSTAKKEFAEDKEGTDYNYVPDISKLSYDVDFGGSFGKTTNLVDLLDEQTQKAQRENKKT